ncbi:bifunctional diaminohydroxyphosphoribosylaminopyrimidine deaminase/5-amino-6-(5-phosphoribosylamino)uracil reductase RibD [Gilvimarinus sp. SDUM040013]|uniref:Riboflavin biosynthesis protein RibD n=1 Tax=Gilvimarinus gilvus TaxID=3058038 RepID=A0ABU4S4G6_9GAMM|nr:bifunctional diaminohydroxyphosphoribosylaminopyrimidine deaminase/5-amino-6-(5-phosphoribosylamino)uracil reductase RibD [Gilvimarinus sp. SDUM040013]MDO3387225.1 bifunctional diaminohydroxyphosphoribosylaminopyrimidine deaminase/5-amino-6-(5-phosphoribosylamino)uracil reductase RibD [Gilvimarinus sp. SDUM040013]MDX6850788.1 bifunctional diaminohydroxyphosphoribosylaminopyrimidine deaminase/5-amino-6-(5-phosphoribosylamino)uracil reductase RibD [Gilvimarinus sp. SDUM040013]
MNDSVYMAEALSLARRGIYTVTPNPAVGCVLVRDGVVIGRGWHKQAGGHHAEINAMRDACEQAGLDPNDAQARNQACAGADCYVTLEPCSHTGRTGPCAAALIEAGIARLVYAMEDPNPQVAGRGLEMLEDAGIAVAGPVLEDEALALNRGFVRRMSRGRPWMRCKLAMSLDGRTAMESGESHWVTARRAREDVQRLRAASCAIVSGVDTVLLDKASLTVRREDWLEAPEGEEIRQPLRVVLDSTGRLTADAPLVQLPFPILLIHTEEVDASGWPDHVEHLVVPARDGRVSPLAVVQELAKRGINEVLVEAGAKVAGSFLRLGLLDELIIYMAPKLLGNKARGLFDLPIDAMAGQLPLEIKDMRAVGQDWRITAVPDFDS